MQKLTAFPFTSKMTFDEKGWPQLDRGVTSEVLRKVLKNYYTNGVFGINDSTCLQVAASTDGSATVKVKPGVCLIQGATGYTEEEASLELTAGDTALPRIDTVVARLNDNTDYRAIYLDIVIGTPATTPQPPALTRSDSIWEIGLANLRRAANSTIITNSEITDTRPDSSRCGYVTAINSLDTESLMQQLNAYYDEFVAQCETDYNVSRQQYLLQCQNIVDDVRNFTDATEEEILVWFQSMKDQLTEDAAIHLQVQINRITEKEFLEKYGLVNKTTTILKDEDGITQQIVESSVDDDVIATTTFTRDTEGTTTMIETDVVPGNDSFHYIKIVEFETIDENGSRRASENYQKIAKE